MAKADKDPWMPPVEYGSMEPMTAIIKSYGRMVDSRMAPCGDNKIYTPYDRGGYDEEDEEY